MVRLATILLGFLLTAPLWSNAGIGLPSKERTKVFVLSVGIDSYSTPYPPFRYCVSDALAFTNKIYKDYSVLNSDSVDWMNAKTLINGEATKENILKELQAIAAEAKPEDEFYFFFAGITREYVSEYESCIVPFCNYKELEPFDEYSTLKRREQNLIEEISESSKYQKLLESESSEESNYLQKLQEDLKLIQKRLKVFTEQYILEPSIVENNALSLKEFAEQLDKISCYSQLIVTESGNGAEFARNLMIELYDIRPQLARLDRRQRVIITTKSYGADNSQCSDRSGGPLLSFILQNGPIWDAMNEESHRYMTRLYSKSNNCSVFGTKQYAAMYFEADYRKLLQAKYAISKGTTRGAGVDFSTPPVTTEGKTYGLFLATNQYDPNNGWQSLKNPINDAEAISELLKTHYGVEVIKAYDKTIDEAVLAIDSVTSKLNENDRFILFVAGHGYYSERFKDGYLVFKDGEDPNQSIRHNSYYSMAGLHRVINNVPCKNVFLVFDICFGASFDLNGRELFKTTYENKDISLSELARRKSEKKTRIFLASGEYEVPDYWDTSLDHSPFAAKLIKALKKEKEFVNPAKLYNYLAGNATEVVLKSFESHSPDGDFILLKKR
jgi:hypothetical protein